MDLQLHVWETGTSRLTPLAVYSYSFIFLESVEVSCQHGNVETASKNPQQQAPFSHRSDTWEINLHGCTMVRLKNGKFELSQATSDLNRASWKGSSEIHLQWDPPCQGSGGRVEACHGMCGVLQAHDCPSYHPFATLSALCSQACPTTPPSHLPFMMFIPVSLSISSNLTLNFSCFGIPNLHQYTRAETQPVAAFCTVSPEQSECCIYVESGGTSQTCAMLNSRYQPWAILLDIFLKQKQYTWEYIQVPTQGFTNQYKTRRSRTSHITPCFNVLRFDHGGIAAQTFELNSQLFKGAPSSWDQRTSNFRTPLCLCLVKLEMIQWLDVSGCHHCVLDTMDVHNAFRGRNWCVLIPPIYLTTLARVDFCRGNTFDIKSWRTLTEAETNQLSPDDLTTVDSNHRVNRTSTHASRYLLSTTQFQVWSWILCPDAGHKKHW